LGERVRGMNESKRFADRIEEAIRKAEARYVVDRNRVSSGPGAQPAANEPEITNRPDDVPAVQKRAPSEAMSGC
jgi:hypothetical protein